MTIRTVTLNKLQSSSSSYYHCGYSFQEDACLTISIHHPLKLPSSCTQRTFQALWMHQFTCSSCSQKVRHRQILTMINLPESSLIQTRELGLHVPLVPSGMTWLHSRTILASRCSKGYQIHAPYRPNSRVSRSGNGGVTRGSLHIMVGHPCMSTTQLCLHICRVLRRHCIVDY